MMMIMTGGSLYCVSEQIDRLELRLILCVCQIDILM